MPKSDCRIRQCKNCQKEYELGVDSSQHRYCSIECRNLWHSDRWKKYRKPEKRREYWLKHKYGISENEYLNLLEEQGNRCAICKTDKPMGYGWHIDHCHSRNTIRGILCQKCNQALGLFNDKTETIKEAIKYLENYTDDC
jgi:hypothetical protein